MNHETTARRKKGNLRQRGSEIVEFALVVVPFLAMITVLMDISWSVFVKSTLQRAVGVAADQGVSLTQSQLASGACLTDTVKGLVQTNSFGMLSGSTGLAMIKVNYFQPPSPGSTAAATDVSTLTTADTPGNIMQVSVQNYPILPLIPRLVSLNQSPDNSPLNVTLYAAGVIQLTSDPVSCLGTAP